MSEVFKSRLDPGIYICHLQQEYKIHFWSNSTLRLVKVSNGEFYTTQVDAVQYCLTDTQVPLPFSLAIKYNWVPKTLSLLKINNDFCMSSNIHYLCPYVQVGSKYLSLHFLYKFWCNLWTPRSATKT